MAGLGLQQTLCPGEAVRRHRGLEYSHLLGKVMSCYNAFGVKDM